ncbi:hypothetical protein EMCRGX_G018698 [Ephydatia muelleri]
MADTLNPQVTSSSLDLNTGIMTLNFSETVDITTIMASQIGLSSSPNGTQYSLTVSAALSYLPSASVRVGVAPIDLNYLKLFQICVNGCYASYTSKLINDTSGRAVVSRLSPNPLIVSPVVPDTTPPLLVEFSLFNYVTSTITLVFNEPVRNSSVVASAILLQDIFSYPNSKWVLTGPISTTTNFTSLTIQLPMNDIFAILNTLGLCTLRSNCYVRLNANFTADLAGIPNAATLDGLPGYPVTNLITDVISPMLQQFSLDMNTGVLSLTFSKPIIVPSTYYYTLVGGGLINASSDRLTVNLSLSTIDLNQLKMSTFAFSKNTTFISLAAGTVTDASTNQIVAINTTSAKQAAGFVSDTTPPQLSNFTLDLNSQSLLMTFNEPVLLNSVTITGISLQNSSTAPITAFSLTPGTVFSSSINVSTVVTISLSTADVTFIELNPDFVKNVYNTHITISNGSILDTVSNGIILTTPLKVGAVILDMTRPQLLSFGIDIQAGIVNLTFSSVVNTATFDATAFTIQSTKKSVTGQVVRLSNSTITQSGNGFSIVMQLSLADQIAIRDTAIIATSMGTTFLTMQAYAVENLYTVNVLAIVDGKAIPCFQLCSGQCPTNSSITLYNPYIFGASLKLSSGAVTRLANGSTITLMLSNQDLDSLILNVGLWSAMNNTYLNASYGFVRDLSGNLAQNLSMQMVRFYTSDTYPPKVQSFTLDMNNGMLVLTMSELINGSTFSPICVVLQGVSNATLSPLSVYRLTATSSAPSNASRKLMIQLSSNDLNALKSNHLLAKSIATTYLSIESLAIMDIAGNNVSSISNELAIQASNYVQDYSNPILLSFGLDMNMGILTLNFSAVVDVTTLNFTGITLQSSPAFVSGIPTYQLTSGTTSQQHYAVSVVAALSKTDINALQLISNLATQLNNTYISVTPRAIQSDTTPPMLTSFDLDMNVGFLNLTFNEDVRASSFMVQLFGLSASPAISSAIPLSSSHISTGNGLFMDIALSTSDLNVIKLSAPVGQSRQSTYLVINQSAVTDMAGNNIAGFMTAQLVNNLVRDDQPPILTQFNMDVAYTRTVQLVFSEVINVGTFRLSTLTLVNSTVFSPAPRMFQFTLSSTISSPYPNTIVITISDTDFTFLTDLVDIATSTNNTFLNLTKGAVLDLSVNQLNTVAFFPVTNLTKNTVPPILRNFSLDMNNGLLSMTFSAAINLGSVNPSQITIQNTSNGSGSSYTLKGLTSNVRPVPNIAQLMLSNADLNGIKAAGGLATMTNNTFISITLPT